MNIPSASQGAAGMAARLASVEPNPAGAGSAAAAQPEPKGGLLRDRIDVDPRHHGQHGDHATHGTHGDSARLSPAERIAAIQEHMADRVADLRGSLDLDEGQRAELTAALRELDSSLGRILSGYEDGKPGEGLGRRLQSALGVFRKHVGEAVAPPAGDPAGDGGEAPDALSATERVEAIASRFAERLDGLAESSGLDPEGRASLLESAADLRRTLARVAGILDRGGVLTDSLRGGLRDALHELRSDVATIFGGGGGSHLEGGGPGVLADGLAPRRGGQAPEQAPERSPEPSSVRSFLAHLDALADSTASRARIDRTG